MTTWSEAFEAYRLKRGLSKQQCAFALQLAPSFIHYWSKGGRPRSDETRARIEEWSAGEVPASLPRDPMKPADESGASLTATSKANKLAAG